MSTSETCLECVHCLLQFESLSHKQRSVLHLLRAFAEDGRDIVEIVAAWHVQLVKLLVCVSLDIRPEEFREVGIQGRPHIRAHRSCARRSVTEVAVQFLCFFQEPHPASQSREDLSMGHVET